jgi:UDP-GlcNAc:undecaprenyl-phosphate GlcNAc-1-phosphate transferase
MLPQLAAALLGFLITLVIIPQVIRFAREHNVLDYPTDGRRVHDAPIPRMGGVALFAASLVAASLVFAWYRLYRSEGIALAPALPGLLFGCAIIFATGLIDDIRGVTPALKLIMQTIAAVCAIAYGFRVTSITVAGNASYSLGILSTPITILWVVGMTNAFNLIDGVDGLAGTMALIGLTSCIAADFLLHNGAGFVASFAVLGATFAFLRYNHAPARIFLGDSGSMLLGYFLSIGIVYCSTTAAHGTYVLLPLTALAFPLTDTGIAIARRWLRKEPLSRADGRHVHHQILALGISPKRAVELLGIFFFCVALLGISIVFAPPRVTFAFVIAGVVLLFSGFFYGVRWLRYSEFLEFGASVTSVLRNARGHLRNKVLAGELADRLRGAETIAQLNALLDASACELQLLEISIIPDAPYYAAPKLQQISPVSARPFRVDYPIAWEEGGHTHELLLRLWCEHPDERRHIGAERIAMRLGAALELWIREHPAAFPAHADANAKHVPAGVHKQDR